MTLEKRIAAVFGMNDAAWERHANPWSVWTRTSALPLLIVAFWSRVWLGWWSLVPIVVTALWTWLNPRLFSVPSSTDNWASKAVFGERVWLNRQAVPVPQRHRLAPNVLSVVSALGSLLVIWGVYDLAVWPTVLGAVIVYLAKLWFLDRMVWLYEDMKEISPEYRRWVRS